MFTVNGNILLEDELSILQELRNQCIINGNDLFRDIRPTGVDNIMVTCPFHKGGKERKPSFGVHRKTMQCHCFTCGWSGPLDEVVSLVFGHEDEGDFGRQWLTKNFLTVAVEDRKPLSLNLSRGKVEIQLAPGFTEEELDSYRYYHPYMYKRGLTNEIIEEFDIGYDGATKCITFPVYDHNKNPCFIARRSVVTKFFNYPDGVQKPVYGSHRIVQDRPDTVVIAESILNALTCWKHGIPAVALIGTGTNQQYDILRSLPCRKYILALDPDEAGYKASARLRQALSQFKIITQYVIPSGEDLNSLDDKILTLQEIY